MSSKPKTKNPLTDEVARLRGLVEEQQIVLNDQRLRLAALEAKDANDHGGSANGNGNGNERHSRRDLLRMAGMAAAGAAGAVGVTALQTLPAAAATNGAFTLGKANDADAPTILNPSVAAPTVANAPGLLDVDGSITSGATPNLAVNATTNFFRSVRGIAPLTQPTGPSGVGVWGSSDAGAGVVGSSTTGVDLWAFNSGRVMQAAQPAGPPTYQGGVYDTTASAWTDFELVRDQNGVLWIYLPPSVSGANVAPGTGTWFPLQPGGIGATGPQDSKGVLFSAVSTSLMALKNSDGVTFTDMMVDPLYVPATPAQMVLSITPAFNCRALISAGADLYTDTVNVKQDIGIFVNPGDPLNPPNNAQHIEGWKENGAGTVQQPNAAYVHTVFRMIRGTTYDVRLKWKTNTNAPNVTIRAGAGPFGNSGSLATNVSPTRLTALLLIDP